MSNAVSLFGTLGSQPASRAQDDVEDAFRDRILAAMRDLRARERRASCPDLRLGDAANDDATAIVASSRA